MSKLLLSWNWNWPLPVIFPPAVGITWNCSMERVVFFCSRAIVRERKETLSISIAPTFTPSRITSGWVTAPVTWIFACIFPEIGTGGNGRLNASITWIISTASVLASRFISGRSLFAWLIVWLDLLIFLKGNSRLAINVSFLLFTLPLSVGRSVFRGMSKVPLVVMGIVSKVAVTFSNSTRSPWNFSNPLVWRKGLGNWGKRALTLSSLTVPLKEVICPFFKWTSSFLLSNFPACKLRGNCNKLLTSVAKNRSTASVVFSCLLRRKNSPLTFILPPFTKFPANLNWIFSLKKEVFPELIFALTGVLRFPDCDLPTNSNSAFFSPIVRKSILMAPSSAIAISVDIQANFWSCSM